MKSEAEGITHGTRITGKLNELRPVDEYLRDYQDFNTFRRG